MSEVKRVCVTGASGFLGRHLVRQLIEEDGCEVVAFCRHPDKGLRSLGATVIQGSVLEPSELEYALDGCEAVFHLAGRVDRLPENAHLLHELHVQGTLNVIAAAKKLAVGRMIYASTSGTVGVSTEPELIGDDAHTAEDLCGRWPYYLSKIYAEKAVRTAVSRGDIDAVILRPTLLLGPGDYKLSSTEDVFRYMKNGLRVVPPGGMSFVDVRDVAKAFRTALDKGKTGETYLLGSINLSIRDFYERLARLTKKTPPMLVASDKATKLSARLLWALGEKAQDQVDMDPVTLSMAHHYWYIDWRKAMRELDFAPRDPGETLYDTVHWLRTHFLEVRRGRSSDRDQRLAWREDDQGIDDGHRHEDPSERWARRLGFAARTAASVAGQVGRRMRDAGTVARHSIDAYRQQRPGANSANGAGEGGLESLLTGGMGLELLTGGEPVVSSQSGWTPPAAGKPANGEADPERTDELKAELLSQLHDAGPEALEAALWAFQRTQDN